MISDQMTLKEWVTVVMCCLSLSRSSDAYEVFKGIEVFGLVVSPDRSQRCSNQYHS